MSKKYRGFLHVTLAAVLVMGLMKLGLLTHDTFVVVMLLSILWHVVK